MTQQTRRRLVAVVFAIIALPAALIAWQYVKLRSYQKFIHEHYATEIEQLEAAMQQWPEDRFADEATYEKVERLREELRKTFSSGDFYCAHWSFDSHHGMQGTGLPDSGFSRSSPRTIDELWQSLYYGKSFDGAPLLVYERRLPNAPVMKHIEIVLYRDKVDESIKGKRER